MESITGGGAAISLSMGSLMDSLRRFPYIWTIIPLLLVLVATTTCQKAPVTGRDQLIFYSEEKEIEMGLGAFRSFLRQAPLSNDPALVALVNRVGDRIAAVANKPEYDWEFAVIQEDRVPNAWALPGGKVAVYTGILKFTKDEDGLATVIGHEVAHALQRHGNERVSRGWIDQALQVGAIAAAATGGVDPGFTQGFLSAYGVGVSLPFNRLQESEADTVGLILMAKAGYDPRASVDFWERMSGCPRKWIGKLCFRSGAGVPEFLSTHPSDENRIKHLERLIDRAMPYYEAAKRDVSSVIPEG